MNVISFKILREFYTTHSDSKTYLTSWFKTVRKADWKDFNAVKNDFRSVDLIADNRLIFNIKGNHYRLIARINFEHQRIMIKWIGTHADYDKINAGTI
ncbi:MULTISPECIES: type II toxin-antitoxin system HigB family toxin [Dyadobacter]|uniref:Type II toxin-antitoxin system HigB family toxin n=1 Tax=Dyadobacter chenhuakuii TaxID=2909339 RepID=A0ABY4XJT0_9BACT|nr:MULTISPECIES: type II toxin-antitoxin system HigB family toxin [Dyadobacter]MCF2496401.1 type II toxin-antitoxin system HigB family toxin [Dyadobacter chenhuakuii]MCF2519433.1 type II toxin-antitoxin system HigB family toxin [Dyadobacter sp. CY351]USJ30458.1 type II toxin-antitoxin system HigB family toxin [Dyadobacter chenhuakuii]